MSTEERVKEIAVDSLRAATRVGAQREAERELDGVPMRAVQRAPLFHQIWQVGGGVGALGARRNGAGGRADGTRRRESTPQFYIIPQKYVFLRNAQ